MELKLLNGVAMQLYGSVLKDVAEFGSEVGLIGGLFGYHPPVVFN